MGPSGTLPRYSGGSQREKYLEYGRAGEPGISGKEPSRRDGLAAAL